jgi:mono/diheme cytochrome c family protein
MWLLLLLGSAPGAQPDLIPTDAASIDCGERIYMGSCSGCHGATGEGSQGPSLLSGRASRLPDRTLLSSIKNGVPGTTGERIERPQKEPAGLGGNPFIAG